MKRRYRSYFQVSEKRVKTWRVTSFGGLEIIAFQNQVDRRIIENHCIFNKKPQKAILLPPSITLTNAFYLDFIPNSPFQPSQKRPPSKPPPGRNFDFIWTKAERLKIAHECDLALLGRGALEDKKPLWDVPRPPDMIDPRGDMEMGMFCFGRRMLFF